jgi:hypothetical protein
MQQDADFITADFLYMFRVSCAHHHEYKILARQPSVQVVMVAGGFSLRHIRDGTVSVHIHIHIHIRPKHVEKVCSNKICILLHHVGVLFSQICIALQNAPFCHTERRTCISCVPNQGSDVKFRTQN